MCSHVFLASVVLSLVFSGISAKVYTNDWIVELEDGADPDLVADVQGFQNQGKISLLKHLYQFRHKTIEKTHLVHKRHITDSLNAHDMVKRSEQDEVLDIVKRDPEDILDIVKRTHEYDDDDDDDDDDDEVIGVVSSDEGLEKYNDPLWRDQWFINSEDSGPYLPYRYNIDVQAVWDMGYNGSGVVVCVVDDGLEIGHADLAANYDAEASCDLQDDDGDPTPHYKHRDPEPNRHGTRCAGEIAAVMNNGVCTVGIAHNASIGGIRILDGAVTRIMESKALGHNINHIDIFSASWGPPDNGKAMDGPQGITSLVLEQAIAEGRGGKGSIYVWASGNGGKNDDCNADGYQTMRWSISISAVGLNGDIPYYAEPCAAAFASTFSSGFVHSVATTDLYDGCTKSHSGTSAAAPIAAGIIALALQAKPELTWRDVQHIIIRAAVPDKLYHHLDWSRNAAGRSTHIHFGYGILDATNMVNIALDWTLVEEERQCQSPKLTYNRVIKPYSSELFNIMFDGCEGTHNAISSVENVYLELDLSTTKRGDMTITLISPSFTFVDLMSVRPWDDDSTGFKNWRLLTVFLFGENPSGTWMIKISNEGNFTSELNTIFLDVFGTEHPPEDDHIDVRPSDDDSVCDMLCELAEHACYDSANRCKKCNKVVKVDVERRSKNFRA